jgi:hypothetical protein
MSRKIFLLLVVVASFCCVAEGRPVNKSIAISWGDIDIRYSIHSQPAVEGKTIATLRGWRGERVSAVAEIWSSDTLKAVSYEISELKCRNKIIPSSFCESGYVTYQMADELGPDGHGCGSRKDHSKFDSLLVSDCIDKHIKCIDVLPQRIQPLWISFDIPLEAIPGVYFGTVDLKSGGKILNKLRIQLTVEDHILPQPHDWRFHLDIWQNPYAVSRYENVPLWGDAHFDAMRPVFTRLADAGQKVITASIIHKPWNGQVYDPYMSMVRWTKKLDGTWDYGYDVFDRWVEFMMSLGIDKQINCYSMVPWRLSFQYYDEASNTTKEIKTKPGEKAYEELWVGMLKNFAVHLKSKGWFDITTIAMDERPLDVMKETIKVIRAADPDFKLSLAGNWHPEIEEEIHDYCIAWGQRFPEETLLRRKAEGKKSTWYTSCADAVPNSYTFSAPEESYRVIFEMISRSSDGFLRWAYNCWPIDPMTDTRYDNYASGDCFMVYPGGRSSVRFERMRDGIEEFEKLGVLGRSQLEGKKLVACGDSFTEGDFWNYIDRNGKKDRFSPEVYDKEWGCYMTYPYWIARRNGMKLVNMAKCGSTLALPAEKKFECFVTEKLDSIPKDADYILFKFGINDSWHLPVGTIDDMTTDTFCGAWNIVLSWVQENCPDAKVGVIASNFCKSKEWSDATVMMCEKYGVPCLNEESEDVPYFYGQKFRPYPDELRKTKDMEYRVSEENLHPDVAAHRYESLIVEKFLRTL